VEIVNKLRKSSIKGIVWMLLAVFTIKSCDFFIDSAFKYHKIEAADDETDTNEDCVKTAKKLFSFVDDESEFLTASSRTTSLSIHWSVYSFIIFKEPLRDVLTPPPNFHTT
jgi:hypothetical protein